MQPGSILDSIHEYFDIFDFGTLVARRESRSQILTICGWAFYFPMPTGPVEVGDDKKTGCML